MQNRYAKYGKVFSLFYLERIFKNLDKEVIKKIHNICKENVQIDYDNYEKVTTVLSDLNSLINGKEVVYKLLKSHTQQHKLMTAYIDRNDINLPIIIYDPHEQRLKIMTLDALDQSRANNLRTCVHN